MPVGDRRDPYRGFNFLVELDGITRAGFERFEALVGDALRLIAECPCESGCPSCVQSPKCGNLNEPLNKRGATELLSRMASG